MSPAQKQRRWFLAIIYFIAICILGLLFVDFTIYPALRYSLFVLSWVFILKFIGGAARSIYLEHSEWWQRLSSLDTWIILTLIVFIAEQVLAVQQNLELFFEQSKIFGLVALVCLALAHLKYFETLRWKKALRGYFKNDSLKWPITEALRRNSDKRNLHFTFIALILVVSVFVLSKVISGETLSLSLLLASNVFFIIPLFHILLNRLLKEAEDHHFIVSDLPAFQNLRKTDLLMIHQNGVVTEPDFRISEIWIDSESGRSEEEVLDFLSQIAETSKHPISQMIAKKFKSKTKRLAKLIKAEEVPHLGVRAQLSDLNHSNVQVILGSSLWHKVLEHQISEPGMQKVRGWNSKNLRLTFLSVNQQIVAAVAWSLELRKDADKDLENLRSLRPIALTSSMPELWNSSLEKHADQISLGLLPIERTIQIKLWEERAKNIYEIKSSWDPQSSIKGTVIFSPQRELSAPLQVLDGRISDLSWAIKASEKFFYFNRSFHFQKFALSATALAFHSWPFVLGVFLSYAFAITFYSTKVKNFL